MLICDKHGKVALPTMVGNFMPIIQCNKCLAGVPESKRHRKKARN